MKANQNPTSQIPTTKSSQRKFARPIIWVPSVLIVLYAVGHVTGLNHIISTDIRLVLLTLLLIAVVFVIKYIKEQNDLKSGKRQPQLKEERAKVISRRKKIAPWAIGFLLVFMLCFDFLMTRYVYSTARFYIKWAECGHRPLATKAPYKSGSYYYETKAWIHSSPLLEGGGNFFCTPEEAKNAGYYKPN